MAMRAMTATAAPTPIPAFAPELRPEEAEVGEGVGVDALVGVVMASAAEVGDERVVAVGVEGVAVL